MAGGSRVTDAPNVSMVRRLFWTDFNDPDCLSSCQWWEPELSVGEDVLLTDGDMDLVLGRIKRVIHQPDPDKRERGLFECEYDVESWVDGDVVCSLAVAYMTTQTRGGVPVTVRLCPRRDGK